MKDTLAFVMALAILDVPASEAVYIGNNYKTDLLGAFNEILQNNKTRQSLKEKNEE